MPPSKNLASKAIADTNERAQRLALVEQPEPAPPRSGTGLRLFRPEVLAERQTQYLGTVLLAPRLSDRLFTLAAVVATAAILGLLFYGDFTRKARINGWLVPQEGLVRVFAPQPGVVTGLFAKEGAEVRKGERLLTLSAELQSSKLGATQTEVAKRLVERRTALRDERSQRELLLAQQQRAYANRLEALQSEQAQIERDIKLMKSRVALSERNVAMNRELRDQGFISEQRMQMVEGDKLEQEARLGALQRQRIALSRDRAALEGDLSGLPLKTGTEIATIERNIATMEQELAETEARREIVIPAPQDGTITAILAELGGQANIASPLLSIVPAGTRLEAHLYGPSRAVGFVHPGQRVLLRYQAFPYQKFGHYEGTVTSVSRSAVSPGELPPQLASITGVTGAAGATGGAAEPVYRITVTLTRQTVIAYGQQMALQPGMQLEADVAIETRRLYEWVLDPLYTITGKWH
jgi:membrane fusion protein